MNTLIQKKFLCYVISIISFVTFLYFIIDSFETENKSHPDKNLVRLSVLLKDAKQEISQLRCKNNINKLESGGYCSRISGNQTDNGVVNYLSEFLKGE